MFFSLDVKIKDSKLLFNNNLIKINNLKAGNSIDTSFKIYNRANDLLLIIKHTFSCECTVTNLSKNELIAPFDSLIVKIKCQLLLKRKTNKNQYFVHLDLILKIFLIG